MVDSTFKFFTTQENGFYYSKCLVSSAMALTRSKFGPSQTRERIEASVMAQVVFMQAIYKVHKTSTCKWDHTSLLSRLALAVSLGIANKFCTDEQCESTVCFVNRVVVPEELPLDANELFLYVCGYEKVILDKVDVFQCYFNHRCWAVQSIERFKRKGHLFALVEIHVYDIVLFVCFNICAVLPQCGDDENVIGDAIAAISVQCIHDTFVAALPSNRVVPFSPQSYELAARIAHYLADEAPKHTQTPLGAPFADDQTWQHIATTPPALRAVAFDMQHKQLLSATPDRQKDGALLSGALCR